MGHPPGCAITTTLRSRWITDIGIVNGAYACPGKPHIPRDAPIYAAPSDPPNVRAIAPARAPRTHSGQGYRQEMD
jgi:hypothetical protein